MVGNIVSEDILNTIDETSQQRNANRLEKLAKQVRKKYEFQEKLKRLDMARKERETLMKDLKEIWSFLE